MLLKSSYPYTGGFLCCPYKLVQFNLLPGVFCCKKQAPAGAGACCVWGQYASIS